IRLAPCGTARRRVVDDKGKPLAGFSTGLYLRLDSKGYSVLGGDLPGDVPGAAGTSGKDGVVNVALIPGATYRYSDDRGGHGMEAESGKHYRWPDRGLKLRRE